VTTRRRARRAVEAVYATGTVEPIERVVVKARLSEHVARILVKEGDAVTAGQLLAELDNPVRAFALRQGQAQLGRAQAQAGARSPQLAGLAAQVRGLEAQLDRPASSSIAPPG
jgi:macrolide-specific efflux system membrane fusion protein